MQMKTGASYFKDLSRKDYIIKASETIKNEGVKSLSIRRIAADLGCSSASMYRYFKNMDELLFYAQLATLNDYILDLSKREKEWKDSWDMHFGIWRCYATEAFKNTQAFELLFYRNLDKDPGATLKEYYKMFPNAIGLVGPQLKDMLEIPGYYERDYYICEILIREGKISKENAVKMNHMECTLFLGYFKYIQEMGIEESQIASKVDQLVSEIQDIARLYSYQYLPSSE